jgi:hypothetical protein
VLIHIPAQEFKGPNGLSRRPLGKGERLDVDDVDGWLDAKLGLGLWAETWEKQGLSEQTIQQIETCDRALLQIRPHTEVYVYPLTELSMDKVPLPQTPASIEKDKELELITQ